MLKSAKDLLLSPEIRVEFAGFESTTLRLARSGWDMSIEEELDYARGGKFMRLAMRHDGAKLYAVSAPLEIRINDIHRALTEGGYYYELLRNIGFVIQHVSPNIVWNLHEMNRDAFVSRFNAMDPFPQRRVEEASIADFKFFKVSNPKVQDLIVDPKRVPELLDLILKCQEPTMKGVRARERSRANMDAYRDMMHGVSPVGAAAIKPAHQVEAQIITIAG